MNVAFIITKKGQVAKLNVNQIKVKNKGAGTVKGIKIEDGDEVAAMQIISVEDQDVDTEETEESEEVAE